MPDAPATVAARLRAALRFDGIWWRRLAYLGCVYGPEWWKQGSPPVIAALIFALRRPQPPRRDRQPAARAGRSTTGATRSRVALRMFAEFAHCMTETLEYFGPRPHPVRLELPERDLVAEALREGRGAGAGHRPLRQLGHRGRDAARTTAGRSTS